MPPLGLLGSVIAVMAQQFPLWERLLRYYGGKSDETPVPSMKMGNHMQMSLKGKPQPGDEQRAKQIVAAARGVVAHYADVNTALHDGYKPFHPTGKMGEEIHYTNYRYNRLEQRQADYDHPGSILYKRTPRDEGRGRHVHRAAGFDAGTTECGRAVEHRNLAPACRLLRRSEKLALSRAVRAACAVWAEGSIHTEEACKGRADFGFPWSSAG